MKDPFFFLLVVVTSGVWKTVGWGSIIYLAAIAGIDPELYDAAEIDGAGRLQLGPRARVQQRRVLLAPSGSGGELHTAGSRRLDRRPDLTRLCPAVSR